MPKTDSDLIARAISGNENALAKLLQRHGPTVRQRLQGKIDAKWQSMLSEDDVMQETYADACRVREVSVRVSSSPVSSIDYQSN